jgi:ubiquinone/menaquinone biosynthesis C-methylase UbiE
MRDPRQRFTGRVESYARYRPSYPRAVLELLAAECGLTSASVVADVGSGTGILSELFLENGNRVIGIEPNEGMRAAGERLIGDHPRFTSVAGSAESTTLEDACVDFLIAGQAFHWFDPERARTEFERILKPTGWVALVWNVRRKGATLFLAAYEKLLLTHGTDYAEFGHHEGVARMVQEFFGSDTFETRTFDNRQTFELDGLKGRLSSSSYVPGPGQPGHEAMMREAESTFRAHETEGKVTFEYDTKVYYGRLL